MIRCNACKTDSSQNTKNDAGRWYFLGSIGVTLCIFAMSLGIIIFFSKNQLDIISSFLFLLFLSIGILFFSIASIKLYRMGE